MTRAGTKTLLKGSILTVVLAATAGASPPNLVLVTLDTTRADHLGAWGWPHARTPNLDALAARGTRFERCDASAPLTLPSHASILTGLYPPHHGVRNNGSFVLAPEIDTVAEALGSAGYDTGAVVAALVLARGYGLDQGFRIYDDDFGTGFAGAAPLPERDATRVTDAALAVRGRLASPFFLWVHYFDPHDPYAAPRTVPRQGPHSEYDAEIATVDAEIGRLLAAVGDAIVVVVGDHGEMLGEHGEQRHGLLPFSGVRRVPLIVAGPGLPRGRVVERLVRTVDVAPTLLELAGAPAPDGLDGTSLLAPEPAPEVSYWEGFHAFFAYGWYPLRALSDGAVLYVDGPEPTLYAIGDDETPVAASPDVLAGWALALAGFAVDRVAADRLPDVATQERLASLGYLATRTGGPIDRRLPDPRQRVAEAVVLQEAAAAISRGECDALMPRLAGIDNPAARVLAGRCQLQRKDPEAAFASFAAAGESALTLGYRADAELLLGRPEAAESTLRRILDLDPVSPRAAAQLVRLLRQSGRSAEARQTADRVLAAGGRSPELYFERGMARAAENEWPDALEDFREAARRDPANPEPLDNAAGIALRLERWAEAAELLERLLRLAPERGDRWQVLGDLDLDRLGDREAAARCYRRALALEPAADARRQLESRLRRAEDRQR